MNVPPLQALRTLEVLSRRQRVGIAATELEVSHSAVSQTVSRLEKRLGVPLFLKSRWGLEATPQCRKLIEAYLAASSTLTRALSDASAQQRFRILAPKAAWVWLSPAIARLCRSTPDLSFQTYQDDEVVDLDAADFAVVAGGHIPPRGFEGAPLYDERLIPVCSPAFARSARIETPAMLARTQLLISRRDLWSLWFSRAGLVSEPNISGPLFADPALAMEAALQGQGVALCCTVAAAGSVARGDLVTPIQISAGTDRRLWASWRSAHSEPAMRVLSWLLAELEARRGLHVSVAEDVSSEGQLGGARASNIYASNTVVPWPYMNEGAPSAGRIAHVGP